MSRRNGRILAVQALYSYDVGKASVEDLLKLEWTLGDSGSESVLDDEVRLAEKADGCNSLSKAKTGTRDFARLLISGTIQHIDEIDGKIKRHLSGSWDFSRLNRVTLSILRISVFALLYQKELKPTIVIDEAIAISKEFGTDDSFKFINAILDTISKEEVA